LFWIFFFIETFLFNFIPRYFVLDFVDWELGFFFFFMFSFYGVIMGHDPGHEFEWLARVDLGLFTINFFISSFYWVILISYVGLRVFHVKLIGNQASLLSSGLSYTSLEGSSRFTWFFFQLMFFHFHYWFWNDPG